MRGRRLTGTVSQQPHGVGLANRALGSIRKLTDQRSHQRAVGVLRDQNDRGFKDVSTLTPIDPVERDVVVVGLDGAEVSVRLLDAHCRLVLLEGQGRSR